VTRGRPALLLLAAGLALTIPASADAKLPFRACEEGSCATLSVPLDHSGSVPGRLSLRVERRDAIGGSRGVTLVLAERPGETFLPMEPSAWDADARRTVRFEQRGTGTGALRCRDLEAAAATDAGREAAACATLLGERRAFFRTSDTVEDIEALRVELGIDQWAIVGPGYGGYVAQRYAIRYPDHVEKLLLLSPVDAAGLDPLYGDSMSAVRRVLPALCRSGCGSFTSDVLADTARLVERLAHEPLRGTIVGPTGHRRAASLTRQELLFTLMAGDDNFVSQPDYPAAVVSALHGDPAPLLRQKRRAVERRRAFAPRLASSATYAATLCEEVRFPWSWQAAPAVRDAAAFSAEGAMDPTLAAPFDPGTLVRSDLMRLCRRWPTASPGPPRDPGPMPDVPVLVLVAPEDVGFTLETARRTATRFPRGKLLEAPDRPSLFGSGYSDCAVSAGLRFLAGRRVQDRCPRAAPLLSPAKPAPVSLGELPPVPRVPGRRGKLLYALSLTLGDLVDSFYADVFANIGQDDFDAGLRGGGLRGGSFAITPERFRLKRYEYVPGVRFSSNWKTDSNTLGPLHIDGPGSLNGVVRIREDDDLEFTVRGQIAERRVRVKLRIRSRLADLADEVDSGGGTSRAAAVGGLLR
jgi:pimeloyl-ACP methyl ester carboxylesterase